MKTSAARCISIVGHPFVLLPLLFFLPRLGDDSRGALQNTLVFAAIVIVPLSLLIWRSVSSGEWRTVDASDKSDRPRLYTGAILVMLAAIAYFHFVAHAPELVRGCVVATAMLLVAAASNRWVKISLHVAFACFCGAVLARVRLAYGIPVLLLVPALIWSRVVLSRHALSETGAGLVLGLAAAALFFWA